MITYTWTIAQLDREAETGGVQTAHWRVSAEDGDYTASAYGTAGFTPNPDTEDFVPYDQLIEADVLAWVWGSVDKDEMEANLATQIEKQKAPKVESGLPW